MMGKNHENKLICLPEAVKDTTESECVMNLLVYGLMSGACLFDQCSRLRAAPKQIRWINDQNLIRPLLNVERSLVFSLGCCYNKDVFN